MMKDNIITLEKPINQLQPPSSDSRGVTFCNKPLIQDLTPFEEPGLAPKSLLSLQKFFSKAGHNPSLPMWSALEDAAQVLEDMAEGGCSPAFYLSSLDPGVGKSSLVIEYIKGLTASVGHRDVGVIICVSRLEEIKTMVSSMGMPQDKFAVFTRDDKLNALSKTPINKAQVLFTTQQMVERRCEYRGFLSVSTFHFRDKPRQVRIWDEAILPGEVITLNRDGIGFLFTPLRREFPKLTEDIEAIFSELKDVPNGAMFELPDFASTHEVDLNTVLGLFSEALPEHQKVASTLWFLSGRRVRVRQDYALGNTMLDYRETLPDDLAPLLILDASGRVRATYKHWKESRGNLVMLKGAAKRYDSLKIHVWDKGAGKRSFSRDTERLVNGIVDVINSKPDEDWLVVHHKETSFVDIPRLILDLVDGNKSRVHFLHWGNHHGTNDYANVSNVILAGTLFYRPSYYEALGRLSAALRPSQDLSKEKFKEIEIGEHAHLILQALCRGAVRRCEGEVCAPCDAYIIAATKTGIRGALPSIFPGCRIVDWRPRGNPLTGKRQKALGYIEQRLKEAPGELVSFSDVRDALGEMDPKNFKHRIRMDDEFRDALAESGIVEYGPKRFATGFVLECTLYGFTNEELKAA